MDDYAIKSMVDAAIGQALTSISTHGNPLLNLLVFREFWPMLSDATKKEIADAYAVRFLEIIVKGQADYNIREMVNKNYTVGDFTDEHDSQIVDAVVARLISRITSNDRYGEEPPLAKLVQARIDDLAPVIAEEKIANIEQRLRDAITDQLLDEAVKSAAASYTKKIREQAEKSKEEAERRKREG